MYLRAWLISLLPRIEMVGRTVGLEGLSEATRLQRTGLIESLLADR